MIVPDLFVAHFREAVPYIRQMRGKTLVAGIDDRLLEGDTLNKLAADIGLLSQLGIRLVLIHGAPLPRPPRRRARPHAALLPGLARYRRNLARTGAAVCRHRPQPF